MMTLQDLDAKLLPLMTEYNRLDEKLDAIESEIDELEFAKSELQDDINVLEGRIAELKNKILSQEICIEIQLSSDNFLNAFIKASCFAQRKEGGTPIFEYVYVGESKLTACDQFRAVVLKNINVPEELKNSNIRFDVRDNFAASINKEIGKFPDINNVIQKAKTDCNITENLTSMEFYDHFKVEVKNASHKYYCDTAILNDGMQFNKFYLDTVLLCFGNEYFNLHTKGKLDPMLLENENMSVLVVPLRSGK